MDPITVSSGSQTVQFTNTAVIINGREPPYSGISRIWHIPDRSAYAILSNGKTAGFPYEEKDAPLLQALFQRIGQALQLRVEEYPAPVEK